MLEHAQPDIVPDRFAKRPQPVLSQIAWLFSYSALPGTVVFGDLMLVWVSGIAAGTGFSLATTSMVGDSRRFAGCSIAIGLCLVAALNYCQLYRPMSLTEFALQLRKVLTVWITLFLALAALVFLLKIGGLVSRGAAVSFMLLGAVTLAGWRLIISVACRSCRAAGLASGPRAVILAESDRSDLRERVQMLGQAGYVITRIFLLPGSREPGLPAESAEEKVRSLVGHIRHTPLDEIILLVKWTSVDVLQTALSALNAVPLPVKLLPEPKLACYFQKSLCDLGQARALVLKCAPLSPAQLAAKRIFDMSVSLAALAVLIPLMLPAAVAIMLDSPGPVIFRQLRGGYNGRRFYVYKFRTMTTLENGPDIRQAMRNDPRVTVVGRFLRKWSIDELPQLFNVLNGDMSLVGPRPHALAHDEQYAQLIAPYTARHNVKPGITGWAQVNGCRGETASTSAMRRRIEYDLAYIENWSLSLDVQILFRTAREVFCHDGAY